MNTYIYVLSAFFILIGGVQIGKNDFPAAFIELIVLAPVFGRVLGMW